MSKNNHLFLSENVENAIFKKRSGKFVSLIIQYSFPFLFSHPKITIECSKAIFLSVSIVGIKYSDVLF